MRMDLRRIDEQPSTVCPSDCGRFKATRPHECSLAERQESVTSALDKAAAGAYKPATARAPRRAGAQVAQLVEHATENRSVGGSIPPLGTTFFRAIQLIH